MNYLKSLQKLGLNDKEQEIYFALLQLEKATANQIAHKANIKRPTTYDILYRLQNDGFIYETEENKKRYFIANEPKKLIEILENQKRDLERDLPVLNSIFNTNPKKAKVAYFEGYEGIKQLYEDSLLCTKKNEEILGYVTNETVEYLNDYAVDYVDRRVAKGVSFRGIYQDKPELRQHLKKDKEHLRKSKVVSEKQFPIKNEINIYADKMIIITYSPAPYGILIESKEVVDTQRSIFEMAWRGIK